MENESEFVDPLGVKPELKSRKTDIESDYEVDLLSSPEKESDAESDMEKYFMHNQQTSMANLVLAEDLEDDSRDLFVIVDNPEKHITTMESYITFRVTSKTSRSEFEESEYKVRRRFNDFVWLRDRLDKSQPSHLVPPLPEKHNLKRFDRFNQNFVKTRMTALHVFLQRIADHPVLSFNRYFKTFLTAKQGEFQSAKKEGSGLFARVADSFHNMSAAYMMKTRPEEFVELSEYIQTFGEKISVIDRISSRIVREQEEYLQTLNELGPVYTLWSNCEDTMCQAIQAIAKTIEKIYLALQELNETTEAEFSQPIREYLLYAEAIKAVLRRRDSVQMEYEISLEDLERKKEDKETLSALSENLQDKSACADSDLKADMERWHKTKKSDFKKVFMSMCDRQILYYEKCLKSWEEAIPLIQKS